MSSGAPELERELDDEVTDQVEVLYDSTFAKIGLYSLAEALRSSKSETEDR